MAAAAILNFAKVLFYTASDTYIAYIYQRTKFGANRVRVGRYTPFCVFFKMAVAAFLDLLFNLFSRTICKNERFRVNSILFGVKIMTA